MRIRRTVPVLLAVVVIAALLIVAIQLRRHAPPEPARLLPAADAFFYVNLDWARRAAGDKDKPLPAVSHDPEYERFIRETGFEFERDLEEAAFAVHYPGLPNPGNAQSGVTNPAPEARFSEVLVGKFQSERLTGYLKQIAKATENYHSVDIFTIPLEGRTLRVAVLSADSVAASNHEDPDVIRSMVDRSKKLASPFGGPATLRQFYKHVQLASLVWAVARVEPASASSEGLAAIFAAPATVVVSGSFLSPLHLRANAVRLKAEAFTQNPEDARTLIDKVNVFVAMTHSAETSLGTSGTDADVKTFFDSIQVKQEGDRAIVNATMPYGFLRKMLAGSEIGEQSAIPEKSTPQ